MLSLTSEVPVNWKAVDDRVLNTTSVLAAARKPRMSSARFEIIVLGMASPTDCAVRSCKGFSSALISAMRGLMTLGTAWARLRK